MEPNNRRLEQQSDKFVHLSIRRDATKNADGGERGRRREGVGRVKKKGKVCGSSTNKANDGGRKRGRGIYRMG